LQQGPVLPKEQIEELDFEDDEEEPNLKRKRIEKDFQKTFPPMRTRNRQNVSL
jgi:hypothetical protein